LILKKLEILATGARAGDSLVMTVSSLMTRFLLVESARNNQIAETKSGQPLIVT
jgi:hypothetical protein